MILIRIFATTSGSCFQLTTNVVPGKIGFSIAGVRGTSPILKGTTPIFLSPCPGPVGLSCGLPVRITMAIFFPALFGAVEKSFIAVSMAGRTRLPGVPLYLITRIKNT